MNISAIIIDDDIEAINLLEMYLRSFPKIKIIGKSSNPVNGLKLVNEKYPDLLFLDIDMPDLTGLQIADSLKKENIQTEIVFTTAYQDYAYKALDIEPLDFLTKPFSADDLEFVVNKYKNKAEKKIKQQKIDKFINSQTVQTRISLPSANGILVVDIKDIVYIKSRTFQSQLFLQDGSSETVNKNLNKLVQLLNSSLFFQINRSTCVNLDYLKRIDKKKMMCIIQFNQTVCEEYISKSNIGNFEKLNIFPVI